MYKAGQSKKVKCIGLLGGGFTMMPPSAYWEALNAGILDATPHDNISFIIMGQDGELNTYDEWGKIDGILAFDHRFTDLIHDAPAFMPTVGVISRIEGIPCVLGDDFQGAKNAVEYLFSLGHTKIAFIASDRSPMGVSRIAGFRAAYADSPLEFDPSWYLSYEPFWENVPSAHTNAGIRTMEHWLENGWRDLGCTAVMTINDAMSHGVLSVLVEAGLSVPEDVSVVGFDGVALNDLEYDYNLTTVEAPLYEIGNAGLMTLMELISAGKAEQQQLLIPMRVRVGETTAALGPLPDMFSD